MCGEQWKIEVALRGDPRKEGGMSEASEQAMDRDLANLLREVTQITRQYLEDPEITLEFSGRDGDAYLFTVIGHWHHGKPHFCASRRRMPVSAHVQLWDVEVLD
jgi:hypothetical protein